MKSGMTLTNLALELERQQNSKRDFVAPSDAISMLGDARIALADTGEFTVRDFAHGQLASYTGIPKQYYDRLKEQAPELLAANVNRWLHDPIQSGDRRMVRTLDGQARAFLSSKYRPLDNFDVASAALPVLLGDGSDLRIESSALTETKMYIKAVTTRLELEVKKGDVVQAGIVISNSEVGAGMVKVEPMLFRLICLNGAISADSSMRKYHVGKGHNGGEDSVSEFFRDETREADDKAFFLKVQDVIRAAFSETLFKQQVDKYRVAAGLRIEGNPVKVVEVTAKRMGLSDGERSSVLRNLIEGSDLSQWGLINAITATAKDDSLDYDRATVLERMGGEVIELPAADWKAIATAA